MTSRSIRGPDLSSSGAAIRGMTGHKLEPRRVLDGSEMMPARSRDAIAPAFHLQKSPVCCRHLKFARICGISGVLSGLTTSSRKASCVMAPDRGSGMTGHITQGKPWLPSSGLVTRLTRFLAANPSMSSAAVRIGVPSRVTPFVSANGFSAACPSGV